MMEAGVRMTTEAALPAKTGEAVFCVFIFHEFPENK